VHQQYRYTPKGAAISIAEQLTHNIPEGLVLVAGLPALQQAGNNGG